MHNALSQNIYLRGLIVAIALFGLYYYFQPSSAYQHMIGVAIIVGAFLPALGVSVVAGFLSYRMTVFKKLIIWLSAATAALIILGLPIAASNYYSQVRIPTEITRDVKDIWVSEGMYGAKLTENELCLPGYKLVPRVNVCANWDYMHPLFEPISEPLLVTALRLAGYDTTHWLVWWPLPALVGPKA